MASNRGAVVAALCAALLNLLFPTVSGSAILGSAYCDRCLDGTFTVGTDEFTTSSSISINCTLRTTTLGVSTYTYVWGSGTTSSTGGFGVTLTGATGTSALVSANTKFLNTLFIGGNPLFGLLSNAQVDGCFVNVASPTCSVSIMNNGQCNAGGILGNGFTSTVVLANLGSNTADISIGNKVCNALTVAAGTCPSPPPPPTSSPPPPVVSVPVSSPPPPSTTPTPSPPPPVVADPTPSPPPPSTTPTASPPPPVVADPTPSPPPPSTNPTPSPPPPVVADPTPSPPPPPTTPTASPPPPVVADPTPSPPPPVSSGETSSPPTTTAPPPPLVPGGVGDPHFTGADGSRFDFSGEPNASFCLISDAHLHINMYYGGRYGQWGSNPHKALTWIRRLAILWGHHTVVFAARDGARWQYDSGYLGHIAIDGEEVLLGQAGDSAARANGDIEVRWLAAKMRSGDDLVDVFQIRIGEVIKLRLTLRPEIELLRTETDGVVHINFEIPVADLSDNAHGILGQTFRSDHRDRLAQQTLEYNALLRTEVVPGDDAIGFLDGPVAAYRASALLRADCKVARFVRASARVVGAAQATALASSGAKNLNGESVKGSFARKRK